MRLRATKSTAAALPYQVATGREIRSSDTLRVEGKGGMFAEGCRMARGFTRAVVASVRFLDGSVEGGPAAFTVINRDGWFLTAMHVLGPMFAWQEHQPALDDYNMRAAAIVADAKLDARKKKKQRDRLHPNPKWVTNYSFAWMAANDGSSIDTPVTFKLFPELDLAVGRLVPFDPSWIETYPKFGTPGTLEIGSSLCRLGFPFNSLSCGWDADAGKFSLTGSGICFFPNEGIYARNFVEQWAPQGNPAMFYETSSPGLLGQSGGPLFDRQGTIWGIQSHTAHLPLHFKSRLPVGDGKTAEVHQFLNVGRAVPVDNILPVLEAEGIAFEIAEGAGGVGGGI